MGIKVTSLASGLARTTGTFLGGATDWTYMYWFSPFNGIPQGTNQRNYHVLGDYTFVGNHVTERSGAASKTIRCSGYDGGAITPSIFPPTPLAAWYHCAVVYDNTAKTLKFYINRVLVETLAGADFNAITFSAERLGFASSNNYANFAISNYRSYTRALTKNQIWTESCSATAVDATNLFCDTPLTNASTLNDVSGNGRNWTAVGTIATADYSPTFSIAAPTNISLATAIDLGALPVCSVQNTVSGGSSVAELWYKVTTTWDHDLGRVMLGAFAFGDKSVYTSTVEFYDASNNFLGASTTVDAPYMLYFETIENYTTIYIKVATFTGGNPSYVTLQAYYNPEYGVPNGSYLVNSDSFFGAPNNYIPDNYSYSYFPMGAYNIDQYLDFPPGEMLGMRAIINASRAYLKQMKSIGGMTQAVVPTPTYNHTDFAFYFGMTKVSPNFVFINQSFLSDDPDISAHSFYIFTDGTYTYAGCAFEFSQGFLLNKYNSSNELIQSWNIPGIPSYPVAGYFPFCVINNIVYYYAGWNALAHLVVKAYDLTNEIQLADLADILISSSGIEFCIGDILGYLGDNSILVLYSDTTQIVVKRYNTSGTVLNTYTIGGPSEAFDTSAARIWLDNDGISFNIYYALSPYVYIKRVNISSGAVSTILQMPLFTDNQYTNTYTVTPESLFGVALWSPLGYYYYNAPAAGLYKLQPRSRKTTDTLWDAGSTEIETAIPNPFIKTGLIGG